MGVQKSKSSLSKKKKKIKLNFTLNKKIKLTKFSVLKNKNFLF